MLPLKGKIASNLAVILTVTLQSTPADNSNKMVCNANIKNYITYEGSTFNWCNKTTDTHTYFQPFLEVGVASGAVLTLTSLKKVKQIEKLF